MKLTFKNVPVELRCGDAREALKQLPDNSVDSVVTDPPYELGFMGKGWDKSGIAFDPSFWSEVLRVLKPGGHVVAMGGTRTYHRLACGIEDVGFEIRDCVMWVYGTGFPKSHDVSKGIDKANGAEREVVGEKRAGLARKARAGGEMCGGAESFERLRRAGITIPATDAARQWSGWGTALKPAVEPCVLARKPLSEKTVAANVLAHGTGALNIDACRVGTDDGANRARPPRTPNEILGGGKGANLTASPHNEQGRWPANLIHDGSDEVVAAFPHTQSGSAAAGSGSAARFFYSAKASKTDRAGSKHPTVKPISLMQYLIRLVTPKGGVVLDPFAGTGTSGEAAVREGMRAILIEREAEYQEDIRRRFERIDMRSDFTDSKLEAAE